MNKAKELLKLFEGSTQDKVMAKIKAIAAKHNLDADVESNFNNVGHIYFRNDLDTVANLSYDFQSNASSFAFTKGKTPAQYFGDKAHNTIFYIEHSGSEFAKLFNFLDQELAKL